MFGDAAGAPPPAPGEAIDWWTVASWVTANFKATGRWDWPSGWVEAIFPRAPDKPPPPPAPGEPIDWWTVGAWVLDHHEATGRWEWPPGWQEVVDPGAPPEGETRVLFSASGPDDSRALWATDGTAEGTQRLADAAFSAEPTLLGDGLVLFAGGTPGDREPWVTNGTQEGTRLVLDIYPGQPPPAPPAAFNFLALGDGRALFVADDSVRGREPWVTNATAAGTFTLGDLVPGPQGSDPLPLIAFSDGLALFRANTGADGTPALWVTDGAPEGTRVLGEAELHSEHPVALHSGLVLFSAGDASHGIEPWVTDGTREGTRLLRDINPRGDSTPIRFAPLEDGRVLFAATNDAPGSDPWITDGTPEGTWRLVDIPTGNVSGFLKLDDGRAVMVIWDSRSGGHALWTTDGTPEGTQRFFELSDGLSLAQPPLLESLGDGRFLVGIRDEEHGQEPWVSDGTSEGTRVLDLTPGPDGTFGSLGDAAALSNGRVMLSGGGPVWVTDGTEKGSLRLLEGVTTPGSPGRKIPPSYDFVALEDGRVAFTARDSVHGNEAWITDGTAEVTRLLVDLTPGNWGSNPTAPVSLGDGRAVFGAGDPSAYAPGSGREAYVTDGTPEGTQILPSSSILSAQPDGFAALEDGRALYAATYSPSGGSSPSGRAYDELWVTDGTQEGTRLVQDIYPGQLGSRPEEITLFDGGRAIFSARAAEAGREAWVSDGTAAGSFLLADIWTGSEGSNPTGFTALGDGQVLFAARTPDRGMEPWITDGTPEGTRFLADIFKGAEGSDPAGFALLEGGRAIFVAEDATAGREPWVTDGTEAGTRRLVDIMPGGPGSAPGSFTALGDGRVVFHANDGVLGEALWVTDGTMEGTRLLRDINPSAGNGVIGKIAAFGDGQHALFGADDGVRGTELWITDGTEAGTRLLADINPDGAGSIPGDFLPLGDERVLFAATDAAHGRELWITDGTEAGTRLLRDVEPGERGSGPVGLELLRDGVAVFVAADVAHGAEPWITDGTEEGTRLIRDLVTFPNSSDPRDYLLLEPATVMGSGGHDLFA
jgi:ELWxxDGT repeat protein